MLYPLFFTWSFLITIQIGTSQDEDKQKLNPFGKPMLQEFLLSPGLIDLNHSANAQDEEKRKLPPFGKPMLQEFLLSPGIIHLNHAAYGTFPKVVLNAFYQHLIKAESHPDYYLRRKHHLDWDKVRQVVGPLLNVDPEDIVLIPSATSGINAVLRGITFADGDHILHFSTIYKGVNALVQYLVDHSNGTVSRLIYHVTYPITNDLLISNFEKFLKDSQDEGKTIRIAVIDHISSVPSVLNPLDKLIPISKRYNIPVLVDAAHALGEIPVDVGALDPDYYVTNLHKWMYTIRPTAVMYVRKSLQPTVHPALISYNYKMSFHDEFFWTGTSNLSPYSTIPFALKFIEDAGGLPEIQKYCHNLAVEGGKLVASILGTEMLQSEDQIANMVDVRLPIVNDLGKLNEEWWNDVQYNKYNVTFLPYKHNGKWYARFSAQIYTDISDYEVVGKDLKEICAELNK